MEPILEPGLRIVDAHHHLSEATPEAVAAGAYTVDRLGEDAQSGHLVDMSVFVQASFSYYQDGPTELRPVGETAGIAALGSDDGLLAGIVGYADLAFGSDVERVLDAHVEAGQGRFRGIRQMAAWDASPDLPPVSNLVFDGMLVSDTFRRNYAFLAKHDLCFDALVYFPQLPDVIRLAREFEQTKIILEHSGGPITVGPYADRAESLRRWRALMGEAAHTTTSM